MRMNIKTDEPPGERLRAFGYRPENLPFLFLVPFVRVAWAEGFMQRAERRAILKLAAKFNIARHSPAYAELLELLDERPSEEFFDEATKLLQEFLETLPERHSESLRTILQIGCFRVARAAGDVGFFKNRPRVTPEERDEIYRLGESLRFSLADYAD